MSYGAITFLRRQYLCVLRRCAVLNAIGTLVLVSRAFAGGPDIVPDGRTQTTLTTNGATTGVSTTTIQGQNAFNSFSRFNIGSGETINLYLPGSTSNLLNLVRDSQSLLDGVMNAYKDGSIGGNVFFFNPYGIVVGKSGQINVGSLMLATPTSQFLDQMLDVNGHIDSITVENALAGRIPLSPSGLVTVRGQIHTANAVQLAAAGVNIESGASIQAGPAARVAFGSLVNIDGLNEGGTVLQSGDSVRIVATGDVNIAGNVTANGTVNENAGSINIDAGGNVTTQDGARIAAEGQGVHSSGGSVRVMAQGDATLANGSEISARGGESGDGGNIEFSAKDTVHLAGGQLKAGAANGAAGNVLIDPNDIEAVNANIYTDGANYSLIANDSITVGQNIVISTRNLANVNTDNHLTAASQGNSGNLTLKASQIELKDGAKLLAHADSGFTGGNVDVEATNLNALGADRTSTASLKLTHATVTGKDITLRTTAETSAITALLDQAPNTTLADVQKVFDNELDDLSDGPGGEYLAVKTTANAKTEIYGSTITAAGALKVETRAGARAGFEKTATADTIIGDYTPSGQPAVATTLTGNTVDVSATSSTSLTYNVLGTVLKLADQSWLPSADSGEVQLLNDQLFDFSSVPLVSLSTSKAKLDISGATTIMGTDTVTLSSLSEAAAKPTFSGLVVLSAGWGQSDAEAKTLVGGTTHVTAGNKASVTAKSDVEVNVTATVNSTNKPIDATFVMAQNTSTTVADVGSGVVTTAGSIDVTADTVADISASAVSANSGGSGVGLAVAVSLSDTTTTATLGGTATTTTGDVKVAATTDITKNNTGADASTLGDPSSLSAKMTNFTAGIQKNVTSGILNATGKLKPETSDRISGFLFPGIKEGKFNLSGAVTYVDADNTATASIAAGATVKSQGNLDVTSKITDRPNASVGAKSTSTGTAVGGSAIIANFGNHSDAYIGDNAIVDAKGALRIDAQTLVPYPWQINWTSPDVILNHLQGSILDLALTSYAINSSKGKSTLGLSAAVSVLDIDNHSNAWIGEGAKVNTVFDKNTQTLPQQSVTVYAKNDVNMVNAVGILSKKFLGTSGGKAAIGGSGNIVDLEGESTATIRGNAEVRSENGVDVKAEQSNQIVTVTEAGGSSDQVGIEGAVSINTINNKTIAAIDDDAKIDAGGNLDVTANSDVQTISVAGGVVATKGQVGIGFAVSLNTIDNDVSAYLGNYDPLGLDNVVALGNVKTGGDLNVTAKANTEIGAYSVAGAIASSSKSQTDMPSDAQETSSSSGGSGQGKFGIAVSGDASVNDITSDTLAYVADGVTVSQAGNAKLDASNTLAINALAGAVTISTQQNGNGLAGSFAMNSLAATTSAYVDNANVTLSGDLDASAKVDGDIKTLSASVQGSKGKVGVAGSVSINDIGNLTQAYLNNSSVLGLHGLTLTSNDSSTIQSVAGALAFGGKAGIGLSFAWNDIGNSTVSYVKNSDVDASGDVTLSADTDDEIDTISAAIGASSGNMAAAGAVAINQIGNTTSAYVEGKKTAAGIDANAIGITANDDSKVLAIVGAIGASAGQAGIGASFAWNSIDNHVTAQAKNTDLDGSSIALSATNQADIEAYAAGAAGAAKVGVSGSLAINEITTETKARGESSTLTASGNIGIQATDSSDISAITGAVAGAGTAAVGASGSYNHIGGTTTSEISGGNVSSTANSITLAAKRDGTVDVWAVAGSGGGTAGFAGSIAINDLGGSTGSLIDNGANVKAHNNLLVTAQADDSISARAGSVALGGTVGGGGAVAVNDIHSDTDAEVSGANTKATALGLGTTAAVDNGQLSSNTSQSLAQRQLQDNLRGVAVVASSTSEVSSIIANISGGGEVGVAATVSVNLLGGTTTALVSDGAKVNDDLTGANSQQEARVAAYHHDKVDAAAGGAAVGGTAGVGGSVDTTIISHTTTAEVDNAKLQANKAVKVDAGSTAETRQIVVGASGGGVAAVNASITVLSVDGSTQALVNASQLNSHGTLDVEATSDTKAQTITGSVDVSGAAGFGTSIAVNVINQTTRAATTGNTTLNADGITHVNAASTQDVSNYGATASASGGVGIAGTVAVTLLKGSTNSSVGGSTQVNQDNSYGGSTQDVSVSASDTSTVDSKLGGVGVGIGGGGVGAAADVTIVNNGASAEIQGGAKVTADRDVSVTSNTTRDISSLTLAASGGFAVGVSGAVSYIGVGSQPNSDSQSEVMGSINEASSKSSSSALGSQVNSDAGNTSATRDRADAARANLHVANDFTSLPTNTTSAAGIGNGATIVAGRDVTVNAHNSTDTDAIAVGVAVSGGVSLGGGVAIAQVDDKTLATVSGNVTANRNVNILASDTQSDASKLQAYAGGAGLVGLGASVTIQDKTSTATAQIGNNAVITANGTAAAAPGGVTGLIKIDAGINHSLDSEALGAAVGLGGVGAAIAYATEDGSATASVGDSAQLTGKSLDVHGHSQTHSVSSTTAAAGGIVAGAGADSKSIDNSSATAQLGNDDVIHANSGLAQVHADVQPQAEAKSLGAAVSAGVSIGVSLSKAQVNTNASATTGNNLEVHADSLTVKAETLLPGSGKSAKAEAIAAAGGSLLGASATSAEAIIGGNTHARLGANSTVDLDSALNVQANSATSGDSSVTGVNVGLIAAGGNLARTTANTTTLAEVGNNANVSADDSVAVGATGSDTLRAATISGSGGLGSLVASEAETHATSHTDAVVGNSNGTGGTIDTALFQLNAKQTTNFNSTADSLNAAVVGYSGANASNSVDTFTHATLGPQVTVNTAAFNAHAENNVVKPALADDSFNVDSGSGGLLNGAAAESESVIRNRASVDFGNASTVNVQVAGLTNVGSFDASVLNKVDAHDAVRLDSGGAIAIARSESVINNALNDGTITVGDNAQLLSDGSINLSTRTDANVEAAARSKTYGAAGAAQGDSTAFIAANNQVNVKTGVLIQAEGDVHLMSGTDLATGNTLNADADTRLWNRTALPIETDPDAHGEINQHNTIDVADGAQVRSVKSVYLTASEGTHTVRGFGEGTDLYREILSAIGEFFGADTSSLKITGGSTADNSNNPLNPGSGVNVDGTVQAGIWHHQYLTYNADGTSNKSESVTFTEVNNVSLATELAAEIDALHQRAQAIRAAANDYAGDSNANDVALAFDNDATILEGQLAAMLADPIVGFLKVDPITATTGNVRITGDYLSGSATGKIEAPGDVRIDIVNNSLRFLQTAELTIPDDDGGQVTLNGLRVSSNDVINQHNAVGKVAAFSSILDADTSPTPVIHIENTNDNDTTTGQPAQLWIKGDVTNLRGEVDAKSPGTIRASANIDAETVNIATGGDFIKTYTPGFTHQGGDPISQLGSLPDNRQNIANGLTGTDSVDSSSGDYSSNLPPLDCSGGKCSTTIAGNNVYISGEKLNINGLIQAGLQDRSVVIDAAMVSSHTADITAAKAAYQANPDTASRYVDLNNPDPASEGIKVRYDVLEDRLELANVRMGGGHMELFGNIFSTGSGELRVLDGYGRINVTNTSAYDVVLNRLDTGPGVEGKIRITDTAKRITAPGVVDLSGNSSAGTPLITEITRLGDTVYTKDNRTVDANGNPTYVEDTEAGRISAYNPVANRRFNWINGRYTDFKVTDVYVTQSWADCDGCSPDSDPPPVHTQSPSVTTNRLTGDWLSVGGTSSGYAMDYTQATTPNTVTDKHDYGSVTCGLIFSCDTDTHTVVTTWRVYDYYQHSLNASKQIKVDFIGYDTAKVGVSSTQGKVLLNGMVRALTGDTTITATNGIGSLSDNAYIQGSNVALTANTGAIGSVAAPVRIDLTDADAAKGIANGTLSVNARDGIAVQEISGDLRVAAANATQGDVTLIADRNLAGTTPLITVHGNNINLVSLSGEIGSTTDALQVDTQGSDTVLSAVANSDIHLKEVSGDMRAKQIKSLTGNVTLDVPNGNLLDANDIEQVDVKTTTELLSLWDTMKLRGSAAQLAAQKTVDTYAKSVTQDYRNYWQMRNVHPDGAGGFTADAYNPDFSFHLSAADANALKTSNGWNDADISAYEAQQTAFYHKSNTLFGGSAFNANYVYAPTTDEVTALNDGAVWTDKELSNSLAAGLFRPIADTEVRIEDPNVIGKNISLNVLGNIGKDIPEIAISRTIDTSTLSDKQKLALLTAERQDITVTPTEIHIRQKEDVDISGSGKLNAVSSTGNILLGSEDNIAVEHVSAPLEVRIKTGAGMTNAAADGVAAITAQSLVLEAGQGDVASAAKPMLIDLADNGRFTGRARGELYVTELTGNMNVETVYAQNLASLTAAGSILDANLDSKLDVQAKDVTLVAGDKIGAGPSAAQSLEVATGISGQLNASAPNGIYIGGVGQSGTLGNITTAGKFAYSAALSSVDIKGIVNAASGIQLSADDDINFLSGGKLVSADDIVLTAGTDSSGSVQGKTGGKTDVDAGKKLTVSAADDINISGTMHSTQAGTFTAGDDIVFTPGGKITSADDVVLIAGADGSGSVQSKDGGKTDIDAGKKLAITAADDVNISGTVHSTDASTLTSGDDIVFTPSGKLTSQGASTLVAGNDGTGGIKGQGGGATDVESVGPLSLQAPDFVGGSSTPLQVSADKVDVQSNAINATVTQLPPGKPLAMTVGGLNGGNASDVQLNLFNNTSVTLDALHAGTANVTTNAPLFTVLDGFTGNMASFYTPGYDIQISHVSKIGKPGFDVFAFTQTGVYSLKVTPDAAFVDAFIINSNPNKVVFGNVPGGTATDAGNKALNVLGSKEPASTGTTQNFAPAAGFLQIGGNLFECRNDNKEDKECEAIVGKQEAAR